MSMYITIPIDDPVVRTVLFSAIVKQMDTTEGMDFCLLNGGKPHLLDKVRHMKVRDAEKIGPLLPLHFLLSWDDLEVTMQRMDAVRENQEMLEYFVRNCKGRELVAKLWRMSLDKVSDIRQVLGYDGRVHSRKPTDQDRAQIYRAWQEIISERSDLTEKMQIYWLHKQFTDLPLDVVYYTATRFDGHISHRDRPHRTKTSARASGKTPTVSVPAPNLAQPKQGAPRVQ